MARRKSRAKPIQQPEKQETPWHKKAWAIITTLTVVVIFLILNLSTIIENSEKLPKDIDRGINSLLSWYYNDKEWEGAWSDNMEGFIILDDTTPSEDIPPPTIGMELIIEATNGNIDGAIVTNTICEKSPIIRYVMINGSVNGNTADLIAWDIIDGKRIDFGRLKLKMNDSSITVTPIEGAKEWFSSKETFIHKTATEINENSRFDVFDNSCKEQRDQLFKDIYSNLFEGPADENGRRRLRQTTENVN